MMESALAIPEILDEILKLATPSTQAVAAQICQCWSDRSLRWLWRRMDSFYPLLELLSPLACTGNTWEFTSDLSASDWNRFTQYAARIFSLKFSSRCPYQNQEDSVASPQIFKEFNLRCPAPDSIFPNLTEVKWRADSIMDLSPILLFLVPTVTSFELDCGRPMDKECLDVLEHLWPRKIHLIEFRLTVRTHDQDFLDRLPAILADQTALTKVGLPPCSATRAIVAVLGQLPSLRQYISSIFPEYQFPLELGMEFDWHDQIFPSLERLTLYTSLIDASGLMGKSHQSRLRHLALISRKPFSYPELPAFCSSLSASQPCLTVLDLVLYSEPISQRPLPFDLIRPLLQCTALVELLVGSHRAISYDDEDIVTMASSWPKLQVLGLCWSPVIEVGLDAGQPLRSVSTFARSFHQLVHLSIYVNSLDVGLTSSPQSNNHHRRLAVMDFGTSPIAPGSAEAASLYLADIIAPGGRIEAGRSGDHDRFWESPDREIEECRRRATFWVSVFVEVLMIQTRASHVA
ncbi:hypothetical protein FRB94_001398 [Tulasnella sp. JGI-2019a]|nr:hypothetical protein FRB93_013517 [Tulasnella sp. JGI-2019a]KAG9005614.1 hypothetical protein FRB94_001398 [Tulasnella sp. JGI-2019a]